MKRPDEAMIAAHADNVSAATGAELSNQACELARWIRYLESTLDGLVADSLSLARDVRGLNAREEEIRAGAALLLPPVKPQGPPNEEVSKGGDTRPKR